MYQKTSAKALQALLTCLTFLLASLAPLDALADTEMTGSELFEANCAMCHGFEGKGDGQIAKSLRTPPPDLTQIALRRDGVWPLLEVMSIIDGYTKGTNPRTGMPVVAAITEGPLVDFDPGNGVSVLTPKRLVDLATYLETIQDPQPERYVP